MKIVVACTALSMVLLAGCSMVSLPGVASTPLTIMTYNVHAGRDSEGVLNLERVAAVIDSADADIVLLQEIDRGTRRAEGADHLAQLERLTGMHAAFAKSLDYQGGDYGIALLSRFPIAQAQTVQLVTDPPPDRAGGVREPRVGLHATIETPAGPLHVLNTHVDAAAAPGFRRQEILLLLAHVARTVPDTSHVVLGGDLNARPDSDEMQALRHGFTDGFALCGTGSGETFPAHAPDRRIDYLWYRGGSCVAARVLIGTASDHRALVLYYEP